MCFVRTNMSYFVILGRFWTLMPDFCPFFIIFIAPSTGWLILLSYTDFCNSSSFLRAWESWEPDAFSLLLIVQFGLRLGDVISTCTTHCFSTSRQCQPSCDFFDSIARSYSSLLWSLHRICRYGYKTKYLNSLSAHDIHFQVILLYIQIPSLPIWR